MTDRVVIELLTQQAFQRYGDILDTSGDADVLINQGNCQRFHDRARLDFEGGQPGLSIFNAKPRELPLKLDMLERHPMGSQAFIPMAWTPFLIVVSADNDNQPERPSAFLSKPGQAINFHKGTWHGVLTPLQAPGQFAVLDRIGEGNNLEEFWFDRPWTVVSE
ncbi:MAG: ureidoglycolate lyase [Boseongicola sp.]|nr:MAG: ureidoglycolate lyase [Boseongicola sp.]